MKENNRVVVIVVTYNRKRLLERCLNALYAQTVSPFLICVVDNASTDGTDRWMASYQKEHPKTLSFLPLPNNIGGAGGFCRGFQWALEKPDWDWLMVMDDDAAPAPDYTEKLLAQSQCHPEVKCFTGTEYVGDTDRISYGSRRIIEKERTVRTVLVPPEWYNRSLFYVDTATFVGLMMHRGVVEKAGCPDESLFIYYDDTDYCLRLRPYTGILHVTDACMVHREADEADKRVSHTPAWRRYYLFRNEYVIKKRYIRNWFIRYGWIGKTYLRSVLQIQKSEEDKKENLALVTRATMDALLNRLGKSEYFS